MDGCTIIIISISISIIIIIIIKINKNKNKNNTNNNNNTSLPYVTYARGKQLEQALPGWVICKRCYKRTHAPETPAARAHATAESEVHAVETQLVRPTRTLCAAEKLYAPKFVPVTVTILPPPSCVYERIVVFAWACMRGPRLSACGHMTCVHVERLELAPRTSVSFFQHRAAASAQACAWSVDRGVGAYRWPICIQDP